MKRASYLHIGTRSRKFSKPYCLKANNASFPLILNMKLSCTQLCISLNLSISLFWLGGNKSIESVLIDDRNTAWQEQFPTKCFAWTWIRHPTELHKRTHSLLIPLHTHTNSRTSSLRSPSLRHAKGAS